jgi:hypothetical protein
VKRALACALVFAAGGPGALGCADVPTLTFEGDDASSPGGDASGSSDAGTDAVDAGSSDDGAGSVDDGASPESGCPDAVPPGASICCGVVPCNGNCGAMCSVCAATCGPQTLCCARTNNVACRAPGAPCN